MHLVRPAAEHLPSYMLALQRGWSAHTTRSAEMAAEELHHITTDTDGFLALMDNPQALGGAVTLPDGSTAPRIPNLRRWMWHDGEFVGSIGLRWQAGTTALPPHCLGHIGYSVVPWARGLGHATAALQAMLGLARPLGLPWVEVTTDVDNLASQRVILKAGGRLHERFTKPASFGSTPGLRFRIDLI